MVVCSRTCILLSLLWKGNNFLISLCQVKKGMWRENCFCCPRVSRTEYNKVAWGSQTSSTSYNILQNKRNVVSYNICLVKTFDSDQTSYNKIQHDTTRYNKVAKRVQHFIQHQSCMMLYEMLYSFGWGFIQMGSSSFHDHMFIYARSEQCDSGPIYTTTNMQRIEIYPGKFILVKISPDHHVYMANMA